MLISLWVLGPAYRVVSFWVFILELSQDSFGDGCDTIGKERFVLVLLMSSESKF